MLQPTCFLSSKLVGRVRDGSHQRAVFVRERVYRDEVLAAWGGEVVPGKELAHVEPEVLRRALQIDEDLYLVSSVEGPGDWFNHSCTPNAGLRGQVILAAMTDIEPGEEVRYDYAMSDGSAYDEFECDCGTMLCRRRITGDDWRNPSLWERYAGYFSPYLAKRIAQVQGEMTRWTKRSMQR